MKFETPAQALESYRKTSDIGDYSLLVLCEQALGEGDKESFDLLKPRLTDAESSILEITECRYRNEDPIEYIENALTITSKKETRDLALEGRARMERGLQRFLNGDIEGADEDLTWAETRLRSVSMASRDHDLSLLNKASFHQSTQAPLMALQVYGEISTSAGHASETLALSRMGAAGILAATGQLFSAIRNAWNAIKHAHASAFPALVWQANTLFLSLAVNHLNDDAEPLDVQVSEPGARSYSNDGNNPAILKKDIEQVFDEAISMEDDFSGEDRPDLRSLLAAGIALDRVSELPWIDTGPNSVEDPLLASETAIAGGRDSQLWSQRVKELTRLN